MTSPAPASVRSDPWGLHRVLDRPAVLPQAARRLVPGGPLAPDEIRLAIDRLNLDSASYRQLAQAHTYDGRLDTDGVRAQVREIVADRGKMQNPVTGSGGMAIGTVTEIGPQAQAAVSVGDRVATLVSLSLTPLVIHDDLAGWDGRGEQVPLRAEAICFGRTILARLPEDLPEATAMAVFDVCGAPALTRRTLAQYPDARVTVIGAAGKSGSLGLAAARDAGARHLIGVAPTAEEQAALEESGLCDAAVYCDATDPVALREAVAAAGGPGEVTLVCANVPGCEGGALLATRDGGAVIFFSMATSFSAAALGAEGLVTDVTMLIGNGYVPGHADDALDLYRRTPGVRELFARAHPEAR